MLLFTYYGHAAFALNNAKRKLLFDPFFTGNPAATTAADVIICNYILVSHGHGDHLGDTAHIAQKTGATVIGCPELLWYLWRERISIMQEILPSLVIWN